VLVPLLDAVVELLPERVVLRVDSQEITTRRLAQLARAAAARLGAAQAHACVYIGSNGPILPVLLFASAAAGIPLIPLNYRLSDQALCDQRDRIDGAFVVADAAQRERVDSDAEAQAWLHELITASPSGGAARSTDSATIAAVLFTSGTTSQAKAVPLRHGNLTAYVLNTIELGGADADEATLVSVPPYHIAGLSSAITNVLSGRRIEYLPVFTPETWLHAVREHRISSAMVVPTMLARLMDHLDGQSAAAPNLRAMAYGGARMPRDVLERALRAFPQTDFTNAYGLTETSSTLAVLTPEDHRAALANPSGPAGARLASVGRPVPGIEVQIRTASGQIAQTGQSGELWVRGAQVSGEYLGQETGLDAEGWFCTRDLACLDQDGYLFIKGRVDDTIIRGGENIAPAEIEDVLVLHPSVADAAVVGLPDEEWGERIVAAVIVRCGGNGPVTEELRDWVRAKLRSSRTPDGILFVSALPYGPTGKLLRHEVAAVVAEQETSAGQSQPHTSMHGESQ
jgi:acyl-CoA synthetase (AMP-forming)/AMP-acid ligase II